MEVVNVHAREKDYATATPQLILEFLFLTIGAIIVAYFLKKRSRG